MALDLFRAATPRRTLPRRALAADAALAVIVTAAVLIAVGRQYGGISAVRIPTFDGFRDVKLTPEPGPGWITMAGAALTGAPLAARRLYPVSAFLAVFAATMAIHNEITTYTFIAVILAAYSAVAHSRYHNVALVSVLLVVLIVTAAFPNTTPPLPGRFTALIVLAAVAAVANVLRMWRVRVDNSAERLRRAQAEHAEATRRALEHERARIAAELHDVVTHNVSVMVVQAGAARQVLESSPDDARQALLAVEASGRTAMSELRHLLGLLAPDGSAQNGLAAAGVGAASAGAGTPRAAALAPQPGLAQLRTLVSRVRGASVPVELTAPSDLLLPPGLDLAAYRIVQEALTNVLKHAPGATAAVRIEQRAEDLLIEITDSGTQPAGPAGPAGAGAGPGLGAGRGLIGLRERVSLYGGSLDAGPRPGGGWRVLATMPLGARSPEGETRRVPYDYQASPA